MGIKNPIWLIDWLAEQRSWSKFADGVVVYYEAHGFITEAQYEAAFAMYEEAHESSR